MKKRLYLTTLILTLISFTNVQANDKIVVVNISKIFQQSPQRSVIVKQLENEFKDRASELQSMERDLKINIQRLQHDSAIMSDNERNAMEKSVISQREDFSKKAEIFDQDNHRRQIEERSKIFNQIQDAVKILAKKNGYELVIDSNAVAYASDAIDITSDVLKQVK